MNTNKSAVCSTALSNTSSPSVLIPASPELLECILLLQSAFNKIHDWGKENPQFVKDYLDEGTGEITSAIDEIIGSISDLMRWQMVENICLNQKSA